MMTKNTQLNQNSKRYSNITFTVNKLNTNETRNCNSKRNVQRTIQSICLYYNIMHAVCKLEVTRTDNNETKIYIHMQNI